MPAYKVVVCPSDFDNVDIERSVLDPAGVELTQSRAETSEALMAEIEDADALLIQYSPMTEAVLSRLRKCRVIVRYGTGYDNFDLEAATKYRIYAANVPGYCKDEVAAHALALGLSLARRIVPYNEDAKRGVWDAHGQPPIHDFSEQTVGIIGFGRIGRVFSKLVKPLFGRVLACDPYIDPAIFDEYGVEGADLQTALRAADVVSLHVLLTTAPTEQYDQPTYHLVGEGELQMMKPGAHLVNTARGPVVDGDALCRALAEGHIAGAGLDVIEDPPQTREAPELVTRCGALLSSGRLVLTPHVAYLSEASVRRVHRMAAEEVVRVLQGGEPKGLLNPEVRGKLRA